MVGSEGGGRLGRIGREIGSWISVLMMDGERLERWGLYPMKRRMIISDGAGYKIYEPGGETPVCSRYFG